MLVVSISFAQESKITAATLIKRVEDNLNGKTATMNISMKITTNRSTRTMEMESYSIGSKKSFIKITYPKKDRGITFLKINNGMWQFVPRIEKVIKIPSSMMLQSWMGSDFTNDDLVKESSISNDYTPKLLSEDDTTYSMELQPKDDAPVVWGKIIMEVSKDYYLPVSAHYYDEDNILVRKLVYDKIQQYGEKFYPTHWVMVPMDEKKKGNSTTIDISNVVFDEPIDDSYFSKRALKLYSR